MTKLSIIITKDCSSKDILTQLEIFDFKDIHLNLLWLMAEKQSDNLLEAFIQKNGITYTQMTFPIDNDLQMMDLLDFLESSYFMFLDTTKEYPNDYFNRMFENNTEEIDQSGPNRTDKYMIRMLRAAQQSKYGLGIMKKDIQRNFEELRTSAVYDIADIQNNSFLELSLSEHIDQAFYQQAQRLKIEKKYYQPNYQAIEYYQSLEEYIRAIKKEAPLLSFQNKENASGFPIYFLLLIGLSLILALFVPVGIIIFFVLAALYILSIGLESLAISTIKHQGELFMGLLIFFPFLHMIYLLYYFKAFLTNTGQNKGND